MAQKISMQSRPSRTAASGGGEGVCSEPRRSPWRASVWLVGALVALCVVIQPVFPQTPANVNLDANEQLFAILAAGMAAETVPDSASDAGMEARKEVREFLARKKITVSPDLRKFLAEHHLEGESGTDLGQFVSLALLLGPPPEFKFTVPKTDLPPDAKELAGLVPLLKDFAEQANLTDLWAQFQARNQGAIESYSPGVRRSIERSDAYLRFPGGTYLGRTYTIYLSLLGPPEQVHARIYGLNYYLVVTPSKEPKITEIRHQYLHFLLDPLAVKFAPQINQKIELQPIARQAPQLANDFKEDFPLLLTECLIRAVELRMDKRPAKEAEKSVAEMTSAGLILAPYFYAALADYEKQDASMSLAYKDMVLRIDPGQEKTRLSEVKFAAVEVAEAPTAPAPAVSEEERLLNQADNLVAEGKYPEARAAFKSVLETVNPKSERALFGLAVVASNTRKPDLAEEYFQKTLETAHDLRIVTWSHIYLARIYDLKGKRSDAMAQYRAASLTAANFPAAMLAVQNGMRRPFGNVE